MKATHLQVEYLTEPLGLGNPKPRFYWNCEGGLTQTAYQIICTRAGKIVEILRTLCNWKKIKIIEAEVCPDHVHKLPEIPLKVAVSSFMGYLMGKAA